MIIFPILIPVQVTKGVSGQMCRVLHQQRGRSVRDPTSFFVCHSNMLLKRDKRKTNRLNNCLHVKQFHCICWNWNWIVRKSGNTVCLPLHFSFKHSGSTVWSRNCVFFPKTLEKSQKNSIFTPQGHKPASNHRKRREKLSLKGLKHTSWPCSHNNKINLSHIITQSEAQCDQACFQLYQHFLAFVEMHPHSMKNVWKKTLETLELSLLYKRSV